jgi:fumarate hydratase class I
VHPLLLLRRGLPRWGDPPQKEALVSHASIDEVLDFGSADDYELLDLAPPERLEFRREGEGSGPGPRNLFYLPSEELQELARRAFSAIAFKLPRAHVEALAAVAADPAASEADRFVAATLIRNAAIAAEGVLPICQDTGTAVAYGWKGSSFVTDGGDEAAIAAGAAAAYSAHRLRASQLGPTGFLSEANTRDNLPAMGGGSANRTSLSMESPALLDEAALESRLRERITSLGAAGCPPYRISAVLGGSSPDQALRALALAGLGLLDGLLGARADGPAGGPALDPGSPRLGAPLRDRGWEARIERIAEATGVGAQFGGSRMALDARAIRLSRHAASLPLAVGVCCAAHRTARSIVRPDGFYLERLEADPGRFLPAAMPLLPGARAIDLDRPQAELAAELRALPLGSFLLVSGTVIAARDAAHARFRAAARAGAALPDYLARHPVFYAGPTEAAPGMASGSFGPTTAGRMDGYLDELMARGASLVSIAKGGRSKAAREAIAARGGAYLGCVGGAAALAAREHVVSSEVIDFPELGMEAVRRVVLNRLPAILLAGSSGEDFYEGLRRA